LFFLLLANAVFAAVEDAPCNESYVFDGLKYTEFYPEKISYSQNDTVRFTYRMANEFGSPLVAGDVKVLVMYRGPYNVDRTEDDDIIDDYVAQKDVSIAEGDTYTGTFEWKIPEKAKPGVYAVNLYFPVKTNST